MNSPTPGQAQAPEDFCLLLGGCCSLHITFLFPDAGELQLFGVGVPCDNQKLMHVSTSVFSFSGIC